jgi:hypothetical protein
MARPDRNSALDHLVVIDPPSNRGMALEHMFPGLHA